jgi:alkylation response protein AidB-like acyl-CoA dehydrogenase
MSSFPLSMRSRAVRTGDGYVLNGVKRWITNAGVSKYYTVMAVTEPDAGANGITALVIEEADPGFTLGAPEHKLGIKGSPTRELYFDNCEIPAARRVGDEGAGFKIALRTLDRVRVDDRGRGTRDRPGRARLRARLRQGA